MRTCFASDLARSVCPRNTQLATACLSRLEAGADVDNAHAEQAETRRWLSPSEKYEIYVSVLTGQFTQREAADRFGVALHHVEVP